MVFRFFMEDITLLKRNTDRRNLNGIQFGLLVESVFNFQFGLLVKSVWFFSVLIS